MDSKEKGTQIINEHSDNLIIYRPKPKKICISHNMVKHSHNKNKNVNLFINDYNKSIYNYN